MDIAHISIWLYCLIASIDLELAMGTDSLDQLTGLLDLPPSFGGIGLQSLERAADEELLGSFASISASLIAFCRKIKLPMYVSIAKALECMGDTAKLLDVGDEAEGLGPPPPLAKSIGELQEVAARTV